MIHPDLVVAADAMVAAADAATDSRSLDRLAQVALPTLGMGILMALRELTLYCIDREMEQR